MKFIHNGVSLLQLLVAQKPASILSSILEETQITINKLKRHKILLDTRAAKIRKRNADKKAYNYELDIVEVQQAVSIEKDHQFAAGMSLDMH